MAGNPVKPLLSLYGTEWRERGYGLWIQIQSGYISSRVQKGYSKVRKGISEYGKVQKSMERVQQSIERVQQVTERSS